MQVGDAAFLYVLAGQMSHVGFIRLIILLEAVTISASVSNVSQITTPENAKLLYSE